MTHPVESRYSRQIRFAPVGEEGQTRIRAAHVAIVGCGALGTVQAEAMARAGVGRLRLIDRDFVEWSNLQRQFLFEEADAAEGLPKAVAAARRLARVNSEVLVEPMVADLAPANAAELFDDIDLILDGTDNFETRFLINDAAAEANVPWVYGAAVGSYGIKMAIVPGRTACLRCVYPEPPRGAQPTCETEGVLAAVTAAIAALQAGDALKMLALGPDSVVARLTTVDVWSGAIRQLAPPALDADELTIFPDGRAIIKGTTDVGVARSLYARYIGA